MSHTPGPWCVDADNRRPPGSRSKRNPAPTMLMVVAERGGMPGLIVNQPPVVTTSDIANAHLIAAAPDLLWAAREALNALLDYVPQLEAHGASLHYGRSVIADVTKAIAKAEGK